MAQLVGFPAAGGDTVLVEVSDHATTGAVTRGLRDTAVIDHARQTFEDAVQRVEPAVKAVVARLRSIAESPDEISVEFGIDLHAEAGAYIAKASTTANFTVSLTWHRDQRPRPAMEPG